MPALLDITERAAAKAKDLLKAAGKPEGAVRVHVTAGGCSGFSYHVDPVDGPGAPSDMLVESHGLKVYCDKKSLLYIAGTTLDYEQSLMSRKFVFRNPNAKDTCSCGESFGV